MLTFTVGTDVLEFLSRELPPAVFTDDGRMHIICNNLTILCNGILREHRKIFLNNLVKADFEIFSVAFDLSSIKHMPYNVDTVYSFGMSLLCRNVFSYKQNVSFVIDKRYSNEKLRNNLNSEIFQMLLDTGLDVESVTISHEESIENHSLRAVDFIAYEIYQKLKKGDNLFDIISPYVGNYVYFKDISWEKIKKESKTPQKDHPELRFQSLPQHFS